MHAVGMCRRHRPSLLALAAPLGSRRHEDAQGAALAAEELAAGKLSAGQQQPCLCATDRRDRADLGAQLSALLCALYRVHVVFCRSSFKGIFEMIFRKYENACKNSYLGQISSKIVETNFVVFLSTRSTTYKYCMSNL
jgi:hypothetical protein